MDWAITAWLGLVIVLGVLATVAIWARGYTRARGLAVAGFLAAMPIAATALGASLGWPIPLINGITAPEGDWPVLGAKIIAGEGIYVLIDAGDEPRYYYIPWDQDTAEDLQGMMNNQEEMRVIIPPFEPSWTIHPPTFQPEPQPPILPDKPEEETPRYERSA